MSTNLIHYLPVVTTVVAAAFFRVLWRHWRRSPSARYVMWWMIGVGLFGLGTLTEAWTTVFGWQEPVFRTWYVAGALLGGAPLAQGTVYLLLARRTADRLAVALVTYVAIASAFVVATPLLYDVVEPNRLSGEVMAWQWVRLFSPLVNLYAVVFLIGGAIWSAWRYWRRGGASSRVRGNILIAVGAILPGNRRWVRPCRSHRGAVCGGAHWAPFDLGRLSRHRGGSIDLDPPGPTANFDTVDN